MPKIELHVHLEGAIPRDLLRSIARRNGLLPPGRDDGVLDPIYARTSGLPAFLRRFGRLCEFLRRPEDFYEAARGHADRLARQGVLYAELHLSAQVFTRRGIPFPSLMEAVHCALREAERDHGLRLRVILDGVRQWGPEAMRDLVEMAAGADRWGVVGIGLGGDEGSIPTEAFRSAFQAARSGGWRTTVHAGEGAGAPSVRAAIETLRVDRIGHGVRALEDPDLIRRLAGEGVPIDLCPTSQRETGAVSGRDPYPARLFMDRGVRITINTDDPALFQTDLVSELFWVRENCHLSIREILGVERTALEASFLNPGERRNLEERFLRLAGSDPGKPPAGT